MITSIYSVNKFILALVISAVFFGFSASFAHAESYYYTTSNAYNNAYIQVLMNKLQVLIAQLQALQQAQNNMHGYNYNVITGPKVHISTYGNYYSNNYDVKVTTEDADVQSNDSVTLSGEADLNGAPHATVWFEYGRNGSLTEESDDQQVSDDDAFEIDVDNLDSNTHYYYRAVIEDASGNRSYGSIKSFTTDGHSSSHNSSNNDIPDVTTENAENVDRNSAEIHGQIDMNDFENGTAFFVYGEDENQIDDVDGENRYHDIDENGDDLQKVLLTTNLDTNSSFWSNISGLNKDTDYYFRICVEYQDEDGDDTLECGRVENFTTDRN